jgi:hypothetical protein
VRRLYKHLIVVLALSLVVPAAAQASTHTQAMSHYRSLWYEVAPHFYPGAQMPEVSEVPAGEGYTYTAGTYDSPDTTGHWTPQPVLYASPHWFSDMAHKPAPAGAKKDQRWQGEEAAIHEWAFELGGAQTEPQAVHQENMQRLYLNRIRGVSKSR